MTSNRKRRMAALSLCLALLLSLLPSAFAAEETASLPIPEETADFMEPETEPPATLDTPEETPPIDEPEETPEATAAPEQLPEPTVEPELPSESEENDEPELSDEPEPAGEPKSSFESEASSEEPEEETEDEPTVRAVFYCDPEDLALAIYAPAQDEPDGGLRRVEPEKDGSFRLAPGQYWFSASREGYVSVELAAFAVEETYLGAEELRIDIVLIPSSEGLSLASAAIPPARPLPSLSGNRALDVVNIANSQVGYTASSGGTVYGAWWTNVTNWGYDYTRADWCAMFVCWCANQAGAGLNVAYSLNGASTSMLLDWYLNRGQANINFSSNPQPGDFLFFTNHVGLVTGFDAASNTVYFVAGNEGGSSGAWSTTSRVNRGNVRWGRNVYRNGNQLLGYGRPNYRDVYYNPDPNGYTTAFVQRCYSQILGREGEADGVAFWSGQLRAGMTTGASVVNGFVNSPEFLNRGLSREQIVQTVYRTMLDREADEAGLADWTALLEAGVSYGYLVNGFASSPEFTGICADYGILAGMLTLSESRDQNPKISAFVSRCYRLIMEREPDTAGLNDWCAYLLSGQTTGAALVDAFVVSAEFQARGLSPEDAVEILYRVMLDRASDAAGKAEWAGYVKAGATLRCAVAGFASSSEFKRICSTYGIKPGTLADLEWRDRNGRVTQFAARCYACALARTGDASGLNDWCEALLRKRMTPTQAAEQFVFSDECASRALSDTDFIDLLYHLYMGREPDAGGRSDWLRSLSNGMTRREAADAFAASPEFTAIIKSYGL